MNRFLIKTFFFAVIFCTKMYAQLPLNDPAWTTVYFDPFNSLNDVNPSDWCPSYCWGPVNNGLEYNDPANLLFQGGYLKIKAEKLITPINYNSTNYFYKSGAIRSTFKFKYGYFEVSAKMPVGRGYWPAFWIYDEGTSLPNYCAGNPTPFNRWYNEIDIVENGGNQNNLGNQMGYNYHWKLPPWAPINPCADQGSYQGGVPPGIAVSGNTANEHKYAVFWEPGRATYYFDDYPVQVVDDPNFLPNHAITVLINFAIDPWYSPLPSTTFPAYFEINYVKISQLIQDCSTIENFCVFPTGYISKLKKSITIGGPGCPNTINTSSNVSLWATDYVLINEGTFINGNGTGSFLADVTPCPN